MPTARTLKQLHDFYRGESILSAVSGAPETPRCVWEYDYDRVLGGDKVGRIRSAVLLGYWNTGGRHRFTFAFFDASSPDPSSDSPVGLLNFVVSGDLSSLENVTPM